MKKTISFYEFAEWFENSDTYKNNFSREGLKALFDYLEEYEEQTETEIEFDPIALCCEFTEYKNIKDFQSQFSEEDYPDFDSIEYNTQVIYTGEYQDEEIPFIIYNF